MIEKTDRDVLFEYMPALSVWYKVILTYLFQIIIFFSVMFFLWRISSIILAGALIGQFIIAFCGTLPYRYIAKNSDKIREKYRKKYGKLTGQKLWYNYESYTIPLLSSSLYFPLLLKTDYFLPALITLQSHYITISLFPYYIALPLGIFLFIFGVLMRRPSGGFGADVESYLYVVYPKKGQLITDGIYKYIRHPRYLSRGLIAVGFGILANNILAILVALIHFIAFSSLIFSEDKELLRRFGDGFKEYKKNVPALLPKFGSWKIFIRFIFAGETS